MNVSTEQLAVVRDLFGDLGEISTRKMMGGACVHRGGTSLDIMVGDGTLMWTDAGDLHPLNCQRDAKAPGAMPCWSLPDAALGDPGLTDLPDLACHRARRALSHLQPACPIRLTDLTGARRGVMP